MLPLPSASSKLSSRAAGSSRHAATGRPTSSRRTTTQRPVQAPEREVAPVAPAQTPRRGVLPQVDPQEVMLYEVQKMLAGLKPEGARNRAMLVSRATLPAPQHPAGQCPAVAGTQQHMHQWVLQVEPIGSHGTRHLCTRLAKRVAPCCT